MLPQALHQDGTSFQVLITDQDGSGAYRGAGRAAALTRHIAFPGYRGQKHTESGAAVFVALRPDAPAVLDDDGAADSQPKPGSALLSCVRGVDLLKAVKDRFQLVLGNAA